ncbi:MAG: Flp pilus assembly protein CpaB [Clostridia bacterium]|nr:Flp pilus assembly protein CpaB [Clostridia bacterium]
MKRAAILKYLFLPTLVGLIATWLVYQYVAPRAGAEAVKTVNIVVAQQAVPPRTALTRAMLAVKPFPKDYLPRGAVTSVDSAVGKVTVAPLAPGEILLSSHLANAESKVSLAYHVPKGKRAITVPIDEVTGVAGFVQPGDHVDLVAVFGTKDAQPGVPARAQLLLQDVPVLAVGQRQDAPADASTGDLNGYTSLTLAVAPADALRISLAASEASSMRAVLRPAVAEPPVKTVVVTDADLNP